MTAILKAEIGRGGRAVLSTLDNYGDIVLLDALDVAETKNKFGWSITVGVEATFEIVAMHFSDEYIVSTDNGSIYVDGNLVKYTPAFVGMGGFWINGTRHEVTVLKNQPLTPSVILPLSGSESQTVAPILEVSDFIVDDETITHVATRWQVARDPDFTDLVMDTTSEEDLKTIQTVSLPRGQRYYVRAMHIGNKL